MEVLKLMASSYCKCCPSKDSSQKNVIDGSFFSGYDGDLLRVHSIIEMIVNDGISF